MATYAAAHAHIRRLLLLPLLLAKTSTAGSSNTEPNAANMAFMYHHNK